jgi:tetratricopeptide (TPR) repeat protein
LTAGVSPQAIERKLEALARHLPEIARPLAQLSVIVEGGQLLLRQGDGLIEPGGQLRFDFDAARWESPDAQSSDDDFGDVSEADRASQQASSIQRDLVNIADAAPLGRTLTAHELLQLAGEFEDIDDLERAAETYRASLAAGGPQAETCFRLAELLYRLGDLPAARERYYMVIEIDDDFVEARANLGCVLMELGQFELAEAAFHGALAYHGEYPDAHYHLARLLDELGRSHEAIPHWRSFLQLSPTSPWAEEASVRLSLPDE